MTLEFSFVRGVAFCCFIEWVFAIFDVWIFNAFFHTAEDCLNRLSVDGF